MEERILSPEAADDELKIELSLRPRYLREYIGQTKVKENLKISVEAARKSGDATVL